ncbi:YtzI protein [Neobacillus sp. PS2-9]|uniref:YtzI protein n=1 Tax=Neobacillus sp. PS2-9 TaxID=3070676 RepID=UPI0027E0B6D9|nr:YtzI protein [Neobacillus sp. PS2-9]WML59381.1 YtzI protein [Neobacillus sp. PS2-9]
MYTVFVVCIVIVIVVLLLAVVTTSKAYSYKHTIDSLEENAHIDHLNKQESNQENKPK